MEWQHRCALFVFLYSGFVYVGCLLSGSVADWAPAMWHGIMLVSGTLFTVLPQEKRQQIEERDA